ncbi:MAG: hypothetical protein IPM64_06050 [Phycisphaerales bacterium]|nr:hypothetical protein [Phycisphaerales bacterium]
MSSLRLIAACGLLAILASTGCADGPGGGMGGGGAPPGGGTQPQETWAIRCRVERGPDRMQFAKSYAEALKRAEGLRPDLVQVLHVSDASLVYYGRYSVRYDANGLRSFRPDHSADLERILRLTFANADVRPFARAILAPLPTVRTGNAEWNLENAKGYWSLQVGAFYNTRDMTERWQAAEEYCRVLREEGVPAYFHHGETVSSVCIGAFPYRAIAESASENPLTGRRGVSAKIVDPKMLDYQRRFPHNLENGHIVYNITRDARGDVKQRIPNASFPVMLPNAERPARTAPR